MRAVSAYVVESSAAPGRRLVQGSNSCSAVRCKRAACSLFTWRSPMLTVMPCAKSHFVHAIASSSDAGCLSRVMVPRFHPWRRANWWGGVMLGGGGGGGDSGGGG